MSRPGIKDVVFRQFLKDLQEDDDGGCMSGCSDSGSDSDYVVGSRSETSSSDEMDDVSEENNEMPVLLEERAYFTGKDGSKWFREPPPTCRTRRRNILRGPLHKVVNSSHVTTEIEAFSLYIPDVIVQQIVNFTNIEGRQMARKQPWRETDGIEIRAIIGILYTFGHLKHNMTDTDVLWSQKYGIPLVRATMSRSRFQNLMSALRFDNREDRGLRKEKDKLAAIREVWDIFESALGHYYIPGSNLTVDEQLVPFRGRCGFIQYMPMKPDKYGLKLFWLVDSESFYPLKCIPYLGKEGNSRRVGLGRQITLSLCEPYFGTNRNVTADNYFSDQEVARELLSNGLTLVGTVRQNRRFLPPEFTAKKGRPIYDSLFGFQNDMTIVSYQCRKAKCVTLLSTMHDDHVVENSERRKPEIILYYNKTKGGVDTFDHMAHKYTVKRKSKRWPLVMFMNMLDVAGIAAYTLWTTKFPRTGASSNELRRNFLQALGEGLVLPQIQRRMDTPQLQRRLRIDMQSTVHLPGPPSDVDDDGVKRRRCCICSSSKHRKSKITCHLCKRNVCKEHSTQTVVCEDCLSIDM